LSTRCGSGCSRCGRATTSPSASLVLGLIVLTSTAGLTLRLWRAGHREKLSNRWPFRLLVIIGPYGYQVSMAFTAGSSEAAQSDAATLVFVFFGVGLARAWELPGLRGGGLLDLLTTAAGGPGRMTVQVTS
jgi:hypothetical protein